MSGESDGRLYRHIVKGMAVFGGTQMLTMLSNIVKGKFVAILLSDYGMGLSSLMQSALAPMQQLFSFGLPTAGIKEIASEQDVQGRASVVVAFRRTIFTLAVLGALTMLLGAGLFSKSTFGNDEYTSWFMLMSAALFFFILASGEVTILQGYRMLKEFATCNIVGAVSGLLTGVPLYYFYGVRGIVPAMIFLSVVSFLVARFFTRRIEQPADVQSWNETLQRSRKLLLLGGTMMVSSVIGTLTTYFINTFVRERGGISDVGLFQAANVITLQCVSLVFYAMATDYYPHLSSVSEDKAATRRLVRSEAEIVVFVMAPIIGLLILFSPLVVRILLTPKFNPIIPLLRLIALSFWGRALCFPIDYVCIAKGDKSFFFWTQGVWSNVKRFALMAMGYAGWGLIGLGCAVVLDNLIDIVVSLLLNRWRYQVSYSMSMLRFVVPLFLLNLSSLVACFTMNTVYSTIVMSLSAVVTCVISYRLLRRRLKTD